jgi:N-acetylglutamate synthase-like GNAT family acetyltransferase
MAQPLSEGMQIRRAHQADAAEIRELVRSAFAKWIPVIGREPVPMVVDYDRAVREHMIDLLFVSDQMGALIVIVNVAVAPAFQGRGYGRLLLEHAERLAASLRLPELKLYTNKQFATISRSTAGSVMLSNARSRSWAALSSI